MRVKAITVDTVEAGRKSEVVFSKSSVKHSSSSFSEIPKAALKKAVKSGAGFVEGSLGSDYYPTAPFVFDIKYLPKGEVVVGCLKFSRGQVGRIKKWLFGGGK